MAEDVKQPETLSPEVLEAMRSLIAAIRAVKMYPPNNPIYDQSVKKAFVALDHCLQAGTSFPVGVQKSYFLYDEIPVGKETQMNRGIAQDLFAKGIRLIVLLPGLVEEELFDLLRAIALSIEEMAMQSGLVAILWEKGATHIQVTEAQLDEVIISNSEEAVRRALNETPRLTLPARDTTKELVVAGQTIVLGDIVNDPAAFAATLLELAKQTVGENETVEDRLQALYKEVGKKIQGDFADESEALFDGLARSVLEMEPHHRDNLINAKLYGDLDAASIQGFRDDMQTEVPHHLHEIMTGRFNKEWTVEQVTVLLKKSAEREQAKQPALHPSQVTPEPLPADIETMAQELSEYTAAEMEDLRMIGESGIDADVTEATVRTLLFLLPISKNPSRNASVEKDAELFNGLVNQLEHMLSYLLKVKDYGLAMIITRVLRDLPVAPDQRPRLHEALAKVSARENIVMFLEEMRANQKTSAAYEQAYKFMRLLAREATPILMDFLASEQDRSIRYFLVELIKELGREQTEVIAQGLADRRWYVVRNVVHILAESKSEQALPFLEKVVDHKNVHIRQEVVKGLAGIGGRRAASMLSRYLKDRDPDIQLLALRNLGLVRGAGNEEAADIVEYLKHRRISKNKVENDLIFEGIRTLGKIGTKETVVFLQRYERIRWWKSRRPQESVRDAARGAMEEIGRRFDHNGRKG